jgi:hypothetical protein
MSPTGTSVILKLSAFLPVCIGGQILWNGASQLLSSLPQFGGVVALPRCARRERLECMKERDGEQFKR